MAPRCLPKRHFADPSLAAAVLGATPSWLLDGPETLGLLFESLVVRDLRVDAAANRAEVYHCRSSYGDELDAVVERRDGSWLTVEVKLGAARVHEAARSLLKTCAAIDATLPCCQSTTMQRQALQGWPSQRSQTCSPRR